MHKTIRYINLSEFNTPPTALYSSFFKSTRIKNTAEEVNQSLLHCVEVIKLRSGLVQDMTMERRAHKSKLTFQGLLSLSYSRIVKFLV